MLVQYIPRNRHTVFALLCFVVVIHWLIFQYPSGLLHWHCGNLTISPVPAKQPWWLWINTSWEFIMNDCITTTKQSTTKPCAYFLGYTVAHCTGIVHSMAHRIDIILPSIRHFGVASMSNRYRSDALRHNSNSSMQPGKHNFPNSAILDFQGMTFVPCHTGITRLNITLWQNCREFDFILLSRNTVIMNLLFRSLLKETRWTRFVVRWKQSRDKQKCNDS